MVAVAVKPADNDLAEARCGAQALEILEASPGLEQILDEVDRDVQRAANADPHVDWGRRGRRSNLSNSLKLMKLPHKFEYLEKRG